MRTCRRAGRGRTFRKRIYTSSGGIHHVYQSLLQAAHNAVSRAHTRRAGPHSAQHGHMSHRDACSVCHASPRPSVFLFGFGGGQQYVEGNTSFMLTAVLVMPFTWHLLRCTSQLHTNSGMHRWSLAEAEPARCFLAILSLPWLCLPACIHSRPWAWPPLHVCAV